MLTHDKIGSGVIAGQVKGQMDRLAITVIHSGCHGKILGGENRGFGALASAYNGGLGALPTFLEGPWPDAPPLSPPCYNRLAKFLSTDALSLWRRVGVQCERRAMTVNGTMETAHYRERSDVSSAPGGHGVMLGRPGQMPSHLVFRPAS